MALEESHWSVAHNVFTRTDQESLVWCLNSWTRRLLSTTIRCHSSRLCRTTAWCAHRACFWALQAASGQDSDVTRGYQTKGQRVSAGTAGRRQVGCCAVGPFRKASDRVRLTALWDFFPGSRKIHTLFLRDIISETTYLLSCRFKVCCAWPRGMHFWFANRIYCQSSINMFI